MACPKSFISTPPNKIVPSVGRTRPSATFANVLLLQPLGPTIATDSSCPIVKLQLRIIQGSLSAYWSDAQDIRKDIVATKEGGAITGEERLREHTDQLYSAILGYEGKPGQYQLHRIVVLSDELKAIQARFAALMQKNAPLMESVKAKMQGMPMGQFEPASEVNGAQVVFQTDALGRLSARFNNAEIATETD